MTNAIILHGLVEKDEYFSDEYPSASNSHWLPWVQKQLLINGIKTDTPEIPRPFDFDYESWNREVNRFEINEESILIGHSMGGGFWIKFLSENKNLHIKKLILVAPWLNPNKEYETPFFNTEIDSNIIKRAGELIIFNSDDDDAEIHESVRLILDKIPAAKIKEFHNYGHFTFGRMNTQAFRELIEVAL